MSKQKSKAITRGTVSASATPIAIIGMAGIFPEAKNLEKYWANILDELDCIREVPLSRWNSKEYYDPDPTKADATYSKWGGFIPDISFDPMEFGLPPNLLEVTDVSQLLGLVVARDALLDACYPEKGQEILDRTGVILGMVGMSSKIMQSLISRLQYPIWEKVLRSSSVPESEIPEIIEKMKLAYISWNENAFPGSIGNVVAGRIANRLDLGGTNCIVDAACGSSLAAVNMAVNELALGKADMMITGGVDTDNSILTYLCFSKTPAFSKGDHLRAFSEDSDGMLVGEGIGMLVLKRLADAEEDGDRIYAVIRGIGNSSDGNFKSIYAPRASGQAKAIRRAYQNAGYEPDTVGLIEAHGTGTMAGDPAEFEGLQEVFSAYDLPAQSIALGSVKSQIGHTKAAAGAASLIKASLALYQKVLPATINVSKPNPAFNMESSFFYLNTETRPWFTKADGSPRRAGVSSFGFGGTNFHIAVEEYSGTSQEFTRIHPSSYMVLLSASSMENLKREIQKTLEALNDEAAEQYLDQIDRQSCQGTISIKDARIGFLTNSVEDAIEKLRECQSLIESNQGQQSWSTPKGIYFRESGMDTQGKTVALFPGQGSQYVNMGKDLAIQFPLFREVFEKIDQQFNEDGREFLTKNVFPIPVFSEEEKKAQEKQITATENAQPAIGAFSMGLFQLLTKAGFNADYFAGHSFGELTALWAGGVLEDDAYLRLIIARGKAMGTPSSSQTENGTMIAVKGERKRIEEILKDIPGVKIANYNSPGQVVAAGSSADIETARKALEKAGLSVYQLNVSAAFHTDLVGHAREPFADAIKKEQFKKPVGKVYSNSTAESYPDAPEHITDILCDHILNSVRFQEEIENIYKEGGRVFVEIGPKNILSNLVKEILAGKTYELITLNPNQRGDSDLQYRQAVLQMKIIGLKLGEVDPYRSIHEPVISAQSKVAVKLNGGSYISETTRTKFEEALKQQAKKKGDGGNQKIQGGTLRSVLEGEGQIQQPPRNPANLKTPIVVQAASDPAIANEAAVLIHKLQEHQKEILKVHEVFLQNDSTSITALQDITRQGISMLSEQDMRSGRQHDENAFSVIEEQAKCISDQHAATSSAHEAYLHSQTTFIQQYTQLIHELLKHDRSGADFGVCDVIDRTPEELKDSREQVAIDQFERSFNHEAEPSIEKETGQAGYETGKLTDEFLEIVSEKTGYPVDMLELSMDMEADLGIDSIKRVEILGAMQTQFPDLPTIQADELVNLRTLEQVVGAFVKTKVSISTPSTTSAAKMDFAATETNVDMSSRASSAQIQDAFLEIVSEKTGYPVDMLEMSMDMEADLGIDSIKRVEILGSAQEKFPQFGMIDADRLVELRTLEQVVAEFVNNGATNQITAERSEPEQMTQPAAEEREQANAQVVPQEYQTVFLEIVSEKTGYPVDMLETSMDMEADLGIDSIKKVEILGAMQEKYPQMNSISAEELIELRTLEQIISSLKSEGTAGAGDKNEPEPVDEEGSAQAEKKYIPAAHAVTVQRIPKPDRIELTIPASSMALISGGTVENTRALADRFIQKGMKVGVIHFGKNGKEPAFQSSEITEYTLETISEGSVSALMDTIQKTEPHLAFYVHLEPHRAITDSSQRIEFTNQSENSLKAVFLIARHLKALFNQTQQTTRPAFLTVTQMDGQFGLNGCNSSDPLPGGFAGLTKSLRLEWDDIFCRALDFDPTIASQVMAEKIIDEIYDPDYRLCEIGYTPDDRYTITMKD